jgi:hypothetical protein
MQSSPFRRPVLVATKQPGTRIKNRRERMKIRMTAIGISLFLGLVSSCSLVRAEAHEHHPMQHGFVLGSDDSFASHLVATGHHSRQVEVLGKLKIEDSEELALYLERKSVNKDKAYFLLQAQNLDLPSLKADQVLSGHIVESRIGSYEPKKIIVRNASFTVERVLLNLPNPFFGER